MRQLTSILEGLGSTLLLLFRSIGYLPTLPRQFGRFVEQCYLIGYTTLPIVAILSFFIGSVLALQAGYSMQKPGDPALEQQVVALQHWLNGFPGVFVKVDGIPGQRTSEAYRQVTGHFGAGGQDHRRDHFCRVAAASRWRAYTAPPVVRKARSSSPKG